MTSGVRGGLHARVRDRFGDVLLTSTAVLLVEAVTGLLVYHVWTESLENPGHPQNSMGLLLLMLAAPFAVLAVGIFALAVSAALVCPMLAGAAWLGRRCSGREAWWWVPVTAGAVAAVVGAAGALLMAAGVRAALVGGAVVTVVLAVPALVARLPLRLDRPRLPGRALVGRLVMGGTLAVVTAWAVSGAVLWAGVAYEPPRLSAERIEGTWSDGKGGTLTFAADGRVTADGVQTYDDGDFFAPVARGCSGTGTWTYHPGDDARSQGISVAVDGCEQEWWSVYGSPEHPKIFVSIGDPDAWNLYVLRKGGGG
ncbi:hypothetical protein [Streptomyces sp. NPDC058486]|uniref:hypothetical protein n=1 Tax=unclassified Streptomyces TaxID=2593676 RepID=UPI0036648064